jgi:trk system potassium uptake protein
VSGRVRPSRAMLGMAMGDSRPRSKYGITIVGVKRTGQDFTHATPETVVRDGDIIIVSGPQDQVERFSELA